MKQAAVRAVPIHAIHHKGHRRFLTSLPTCQRANDDVIVARQAGVLRRSRLREVGPVRSCWCHFTFHRKIPHFEIRHARAHTPLRHRIARVSG